jgi:hypothetical protein
MITANDLKVKGIKAIRQDIKENNEAIISFRGKPKYIVLDFEKYDRLRALELDEAYLETMKDIKEGRYKTLTTDEHIKEVMSEL